MIFSSGGGDIEFSRLMDWLELQKAEKEQHGFVITKINIRPSNYWKDRWSYELEYIQAPEEDTRKDQAAMRKEMGLPE